MASYREQAPRVGLARWVECCWSIDYPAGANGHAVLPDGCLDILYSREEGARVVGAMTMEQRFDFAAGAQIAGVRFRPGMAGRFVKAAPAEFTDALVPLEEVWGRAGRELAGRLEKARSPEEWLKIVTAGLPEPVSISPVQRAIEALTVAHGRLDLDWLADQANLSPRQFRRRCLEESGLPPKQLSRVLRFRRACTLAGAGGADWAEVALDAGYFDQSHLIRDFREFSGQTPMAVFSNTRAAVAG